MSKYLISFPSAAMVVTGEELARASRDSHAVIEEAKDAGVYVFGGGLLEEVSPVRVHADGTVSPELYPGSDLSGGLTVLELSSREEAHGWARKLAVACRCAQEVRQFGDDPAS